MNGQYNAATLILRDVQQGHLDLGNHRFEEAVNESSRLVHALQSDGIAGYDCHHSVQPHRRRRAPLHFWNPTRKPCWPVGESLNWKVR